MAYNFERALNSGLTAQDITSYLEKNGRGNEAKQYFGIKDAPKKDGYFQRVSKDLKQRGEKFVDAYKSSISGEQNPFSAGLQMTGEVFGGAGDIIGEAFVEGGRKIDEATGGRASRLVEKASETDTGQKILSALNTTKDAYDMWAAENPELAKNTQAAINVLSAIPIGAAAKRGVDTTLDIATDIAGKAKSGVTTIAGQAGNVGETVVGAVSGLRSKVEDIANPIAKNVETVLKETPASKLDEYVQIARKATENSKNVTPLEVAGQKAGKALDDIQTKLKEAGSAKEKMMTEGLLGVQPYEGTGIKTFNQRLQSLINSKNTVEGDTKLIRDIVLEAKKLGETPSAGQVDKFIDFVQDRVYTGSRDLSIPATDKTTGAIRSMVGELNESLKSQLPDQYKALNDRYSYLKSIRDELNTKLGKEGERAGALMKRVFSPSDANTKKLFEDVLKETGIDLTNEAVLAKYVMELLGDSRQASLLEQALGTNVPKNTSGIIDFVVDKAMGAVKNPEAELRKAKRMTPATSGE